GKRVLLLDSLGHILDEYLRQRPHGYPQGPGDQFIVWAVTYQTNPGSCTTISITEDQRKVYAEFPDDPELDGFDRDDRKFVAVAISDGRRPPILNAVDGDWRDFGPALARYVTVEELC
ncbi:MAG TPA: hypothetical protein PLA92_02910, partial [Fimbriimonadaceae bacterium]|nr:hypothetical protein [Fimbriimonadaceae bacterium]